MRTKITTALVALALLSTIVLTAGVADGAVVSSTLVDSVGGAAPSMVLNAAGNPVISYQDATNGDLRVVECGTSDCTSGNSINVVDTENAGFQSSLVLNGLGNPVISYHSDDDQFFGSLRVAECGASDCSSGNSVNIVEQGVQFESYGYWSSIAVSPATGLPIVSYYINTVDPDLGVRSCTVSDCATSTAQSPDSLGRVGESPSMVIDPSGFPVISYRSPEAGELRLLRCGSADCSSGNSIAVIDTGTFTGAEAELALDTTTDANGIPVMVYSDTDALWLARCVDAVCTSTTITSLFGGARMGIFTGLTLDSQGHPIIAYQDYNSGVRLARCADITCSTLEDELVSAMGAYLQPDVVLNAAGDAVVAYAESTSGTLTDTMLHVAVVSDCTATPLVSDEAELQHAVACYNRQVPAGTHAITLENHITLTGGVDQINQSDPTASLEIQGDGYGLSGPGSGGIPQVLSITSPADVLISNLEISGSNDWGIGIDTASGKVELINSIVRNNSDGIIVIKGDLVVLRSEIHNNGENGIYVVQSSANVLVSNSTIHANGDAGVDGQSGTLVVSNSTLMSNGVGAANAEMVSTLSVLNTTNCVAVIDGGFNGDNDGTCGPNALMVDASAIASPTDNGCVQALVSGCTRTAAIDIGSDATGAGSCDNVSVELSSGAFVTGTLGIDQREDLRPAGLPCDIGAYEATDIACVLNDDFACAETVPNGSLPQTVNGSSIGASNEAGEPNPTCTSSHGTLWWEWTPTTTELVQIDSAGSNFDTVLGVFTGGDLASLSEQACNDDAINLLSKVQLNATAGTTYYIQLGGYGSGEGDVEVNISAAIDTDGDGVTDDLDTCPNDWNPLQGDADGDGIGDICDLPPGVTITPGVTVILTYTGCPGDTVTVTVNDLIGNQWLVDTMVENPSGVHTIEIDRVDVPQGAYEVTFSAGCGTITVTTGIGYYDPSGIIYNQLGEPIAAEVTLLYSSTKVTDPYDSTLQVVPDGSLIMSPDNRQNPVQTVDGVGYYGWDTIPGWFVVQATAPGCTNLNDPTSSEVRSDVLPVLPEHFDVDLYFECHIPCEESEFTDVLDDEFYTDAVAWAACEGITKGTSDTTFSPDAPVTRAQMATFLWRFAGGPGFAGSQPPHGFVDVPEGAYFDEPVAWLKESGITRGTSASTFSPGETVTRAQMAAFVWRFAGEPAGIAHSFVDVPEGAYFDQAVGWMSETGITTGTSDTTYSPERTLNRAQAVTFLWRLAGRPIPG